jgi:hypothetical protein
MSSHLTVYLHAHDHARLRSRLADLSASDWLRGLINDDLEASGEPLLISITREKAEIPHGTLSGYNHRHCRCAECRRAVAQWQQRKRVKARAA